MPTLLCSLHQLFVKSIRQSHQGLVHFKASRTHRNKLKGSKRIYTARGLLTKSLTSKSKCLVLRKLKQSSILHCYQPIHHVHPSCPLGSHACSIPGVLLSPQGDAEAHLCSPIAAQDHRIEDKSSLSLHRLFKCRHKQHREQVQFHQEATTKNALPQAHIAYPATGTFKHPLNRPIKFDYESFPIGIDNHASRCITNCIDDFGSTLKPSKKQLAGISGSLEIKGTGTVKWIIEDDNGIHHSIIIPNTLYVPDAPMRLLSPQHWSQVANDNRPKPNGTWCATYHDSLVLHWNQNKYHRTVKLDPARNTAVINSAPSIKQYLAFSARYMTPEADLMLHNSREEVFHETSSHPLQELVPIQRSKESTTPAPVQDSVQDVAPPQTEAILEHSFEPGLIKQEVSDTPTDAELTHHSRKVELHRWHLRLGHLSYAKLDKMAKAGILPKRLSGIEPLKCASCTYGDMTKKPWWSKAQPGHIKPASKPGECVSVDQMVSTTPGFIAQLKSPVLTRRRYSVATIFVDHYSSLSYVHLQETQSSQDTLAAKHAFEAYARDRGVRIQHYHADNGRFVDNAWQDSINQAGQTMTLCGVNAHHQNGVVEKRIRDLVGQARKMLLHAEARWPTAVHISLWPYALRTANDMRNSLPGKDGISPSEKFANVSVQPKLSTYHVFGCPVYTLHSALQSGNMLRRWEPRARLGLYLGPSPRHARNVSLVLNLATGLVSPQFHVSHDDFFETTEDHHHQGPSAWQQLAGFTRSSRTKDQEPFIQPVIPHELSHPTETSARANDAQTTQDHEGEQPDSHFQQDPHGTSPADIPLRHSTRIRHPPARLHDPVAYGAYYDAYHQEDYHTQDLMSDPIAFAASTNPDILYYHEAMKQPDRLKFLDAIVQEMNAHIEHKNWELVDKSSIPKGVKVLDAVWALRRKRDLKTNKISKHKARLNVNGSQQIYGLHYYDTYSPVVSWVTVHLFLILSILLSWHTTQVDFVQAYLQAPIERDIYMNLPKGITLAEGDATQKALLLKKNLYGQKQAGRVWYNHLKQGLLKVGFKQSSCDECLFYRNNVYFLVYVDDGIFCSPDSKAIKQAIQDLTKAGFDIENKGTISDYLGVHVEKLPSGKYKLSQPQLIKHLVQELEGDLAAMKNHKPTLVPALSSRILQRDEEGKPFSRAWHYRSIIGKLNFIEKSTRPDIAYATHQCARFCQDPKESHAKAILQLVRYLQHTSDQGLILDPKKDIALECYADADFAGNWNKITAPQDPSTAKSRTGYIIQYASCPLLWASKLQTQIALSTTEAEYIALSSALREVIPLIELLREMKRNKIDVFVTAPKIYCKAFEDNSGALELAKAPKLRPRTKHINIIYHHFREYVRDGSIQIFAIPTLKQLADICTKPLAQNMFIPFCKTIMGGRLSSKCSSSTSPTLA